MIFENEQEKNRFNGLLRQYDAQVAAANLLAAMLTQRNEGLLATLLLARSALESAKNGLQWYRDTYPAADSGADDEMMQEIDAVLNTTAPKVDVDREPLPAAEYDPEVPITRSLLRAACAELRKYAIPMGADDQVVLNIESAIGVEHPVVEERDACDRPPAGWTCSRTKGHTGPCAAREKGGAQ